ncbi:MAG TPA: hypothetical protein VFI47_02040 [Acidimicrobiales bacterium]|nr:hypothetical protein [Acidimicrobiales bacterium]
MSDPVLAAWRADVAALGGRLVDIESDPTVAVARSGAMTGGSAVAWAEADAGIAAAWEVFRAVDELLDAAEREPGRAHALLTEPTVPAPGGRTDATAAVRAATAAVEVAVALVARLAAAWGDWASRNRAAEAAAGAAGDSATARAAASLGGLLLTDPLAIDETDIAGVEAAAARAQGRHSATQSAVGRFDVDLARARDDLAALDADLQRAGPELAHAASRVTGIATAVPVADLAALAGWLDRIAATAAGDRARAAAALDDWFAACHARRAELDAALAPARDGLRRREQGRGLWTALRAKAGARKLDERPEVAAALGAAQEELWRAPCDLDAAEAALRRLSAVLEARPGDAT